MPLRTLLLLLLIVSTACGDNKRNQAELSYTNIELLDPTPGGYNGFGKSIYLLNNSNIVVTSAYDSSIVPSNGAIHIYSSISGTLIKSIYGTSAYERLGLEKIIPLENGNFFIASPYYSDGLLEKIGAVYLVNGSTGEVITSLYGNEENNMLGKSYPGYFIRYSNDGFSFEVDMEGISILSNGNEKIGQPVVLSSIEMPGTYILSNGNYLISSFSKEENGISFLHSTSLMDGSTGKQLAAIILDKSDVPVEYVSVPLVKSIKNEMAIYSYQLNNTVHTYIIDGKTGRYRELLSFNTELTDPGPFVSIALESDESDFFVQSLPYSANIEQGVGVFGKVTLFRVND